jgi:hypothetical protein
MKQIWFLILILCYSCGYQPIYDIKFKNNLEFKEIIIEGNNNLTQKIIKTINLQKNSSDKLLDEIRINTELIVEETSKDSIGQILSYRTTINAEVKIIDKNKNLRSQKFSQNFSYNSKENKFELINYQKEIENIILEKLIEDIALYLNLK